MANTPRSLAELLRADALPSGSLNWFTEEEVRGALQAGIAKKHERAVSEWLQDRERRRTRFSNAGRDAKPGYLAKRYVVLGVVILILATMVLLFIL
jgi:hypothetical protein